MKKLTLINTSFGFCVLAYGLVIGILHQDVIQSLNTLILAGSQVGAVFIWDFWWLKLSFFNLSEYNPFFTTLLHYPMGVPVVIHAPLIDILALFLQLFSSPFAAYNLIHLFSYLASGTAMYLVCYRLTRCSRSSFLAGYIFMFSHYSLVQHVLGHLGESFLFFVPFLFWGTYELINKNKKQGWVLFTIGFFGTLLTTPYVFFSSVVIGLPLFLWPERKKIKPLAPLLDLKKNIFILSTLGLVCLSVFYFSLFANAKNLIGGSESSSLSLLSFIDFPAWHASSFIQQIRSWTSHAQAKPEELMGFVGFSVFMLLFFGLKKKSIKENKHWIILTLGGAILSLGPFLRIAYNDSFIPLPYLILEQIPILNHFRTPARMILLTTLGLSILAGLSYFEISKKLKSALLKNLFLLGFLFVYSWEMGLSNIGNLYFPVKMGPVYTYLSQSTSKGGLLELPISINKKGDVGINAQKYMLYQPLHKKPLVVGRPPRHTEKSLSFVQNTDFFYELTHPQALHELMNNPALKNRLMSLIQQGKNRLLENNVQFVTLHTKDPMISEKTIKNLKSFLTQALGLPTIKQQDMLLWVVQ